VPPVRVPLELEPSFEDVLRAVRDDDRPVALVGDWAGSRAIVSSAPRRVVEGAAVLDVLAESGNGAAGEGVGGGWFGYLGYGLGAAIERLPPPPPRPVPLPVASLGFYDHVLRQDADGAWWFEALEERALPRLDELRARLRSPPAPRPFALAGLEPAPSALSRHTAAVARCVERIAAGELFQANLTLRLEGRFDGSAADAFLAAAAELRPARGAFLGLDGGAVLSFSPELFLRRSGDVVTTSPIKGTAPREAGAEALLASAKDAAEHVMIVDLSRNDLGRVARYGSVSPGTVRAEPHPGLWHLVTDVTARLREGTTDAALVRAAFPPGSVTGAPKIQALKVIADLEGSQREVYTGAIGFASPHAGLELNVAIRTLEVAGGRAWLGCGGGIVADSDPGAELREALGKAAPIARALGASVPDPPEEDAPALAVPPWRRRPDPARGLLETIAVRDGRPAQARAHLARLRASARELYGVAVDVELPEAPDGRLRVLLSADGAVEVEAREEPAAPAAVELEPRSLSGGLGRHKWLDRAHDPSWLAVDLDGTVLEAAWANVWMLDGDGVLVTPPADGRILPGLTRARLLAAEHVATRAAPFSLAELAGARAIVLTSSVRLATPAGVARPPTTAALHLAARLREDPAISTKTGSYIR